jgi:Cu-Zn family superoxide dismutase
LKRTTVTTAAATTGLLAATGLLLAAPALAGADVVRAAGEVVRYPGQTPIADAPEGASARVQSIATADGRQIVTLHVSGFEPFARYGAHAHVAPCGDTGAAAGPHFQHVVDPVSPSVDPAYANPSNEVWLDLTTNRAGEGTARTVLDWQFEPARRPASVIIHERHTSTGASDSGTAGKRVACLTVPF